MSEDRYAHIGRWNILLDELCNQSGFPDQASLAGRFCELSNNGGQRDFDTTVRNLNNWRSGRHVPRLRSLRILEQLLNVNADAHLQARWNELYRQARDDEEDADPAVVPDLLEGAKDSVNAGGGCLRIGREALTAGALMFLVGFGAGALLMSDWRPWGGPADNAPMVAYTPELQLAVGESRVIHAERGDCGKLPRDWPLVADALPVSQTGVFSDGGLARRNSKFCGGITPARAIVFTARAAGVEEFRIQGDYFRVVVGDALQDEEAQARQ